MDFNNFSNYKKGVKHRYYGGKAKKTPLILSPPRTGKWYLTIDLGGYPGTLKASARVA